MQHKLAIQSVGDNFYISQSNVWWKDENSESRIVAIGSNLDKNEMQKSLYSLIVKTNKTEA